MARRKKNTPEVPAIGSTVIANGQEYVVEEAVLSKTAGGVEEVRIIVRRPKGSKRYLGVYLGTTRWGESWARLSAMSVPWDTHLVKGNPGKDKGAAAVPKPKLSFEEWRRAVDRAVGQRVGLSLDDLPDVPTYDWYEDGVSPKSAASRAIRSAGGEAFGINAGRRARGNPGELSVANTILQQLGGGRFAAMTGAKHFTAYHIPSGYTTPGGR